MSCSDAHSKDSRTTRTQFARACVQARRRAENVHKEHVLRAPSKEVRRAVEGHERDAHEAIERRERDEDDLIRLLRLLPAPGELSSSRCSRPSRSSRRLLHRQRGIISKAPCDRHARALSDQSCVALTRNQPARQKLGYGLGGGVRHNHRQLLTEEAIPRTSLAPMTHAAAAVQLAGACAAES